MASARLPSTNTRLRDLDFNEQDRLANAAAILESNEMLMWISASRCESVAQTKRHYERILCGIDSDEEPVEWEESTTPSEDDVARLTVGAEWCTKPVVIKKELFEGKGKAKVEEDEDEEMKDVGTGEGGERKTPLPERSAKRRSGGVAAATASSSARRSEARSQGSPYKSKKRRSEHGMAAASGSGSRG